MPDGRTLECHYQCDALGKGYDPGGTNWKLGKGKPPLDGKPRSELWEYYLGLWRTWADLNIGLMRELYLAAINNEYLLSDRFATTDINQARALSIVLNELVAKGHGK